MAYVQEKNGKDFIRPDGTLGFKDLIEVYQLAIQHKALESDNKLSGVQYEANKEDNSVKEILISPYCENVLIKNICADALSKVPYGKVSIDQCANETYDNLNRTLDTIRK